MKIASSELNSTLSKLRLSDLLEHNSLPLLNWANYLTMDSRIYKIASRFTKIKIKTLNNRNGIHYVFARYLSAGKAKAINLF